MSSALNTTPGYSGGWEKVGKGGHAKQGGGGNNNKAKFTKTDKKKFAEKAPKLEEVLPMSQVNAILANNGARPGESPKAAKGKAPPTSPPKKAKKSNEQKAKEKQAAEAKKRPATIQEAVKDIDVNELKSVLAHVKTLYPDNGILWIRDAAAFFNSVLATDKPTVLDTVFSDKPLGYLTKETKRTIALLLEECSEGTRESGFETLLANLAHDLNKGNQVNGYLILLQLMAEIYPNLATYNTERYGELRNSYQNRPLVGTAIIWALGQAGRKDLAVGLRVFLEVMLPMLTMKNYSRFVTEYLSDLLKEHASKVSKKVKVIYASHFLRFLDALFVTSQSLNKELQTSLANQYQAIKALSVGDCSADHDLFPEVLRRLEAVNEDPSKFSRQYRQELLELLAENLANNKAAIVHWSKAYITYLPASAALLEHIEKNWSKLSKKLRSDPTVEDSFRAFQDYNDGCGVSKEGIPQATAALKSLLPKLEKSSGGSWFPWKTLTLVVFLGLATCINIDIQRKGSFKASHTGVFLRDIGLYEQTVSAAELAAIKYDEASTWAQKNGPVYYKQAVDIIEPGRKVAVKAANNAWEWVEKTTPIALDKIEEFVPGAKEKLVVAGNEVARVSVLAFAFVSKRALFYGKIVYDYALQAWQTAIDAFNGKVTLKDVTTFVQKTMKLTSKMTSEFVQWAQKQIALMSAGK